VIRVGRSADWLLFAVDAFRTEAGVALLSHAADALGLSARGVHRTLKVARTIADLEGVESVSRAHVAEALSYRGETLHQMRAALAPAPHANADLTSACIAAACAALRRRQAIVIGPTPPGTGVIAPATFAHSS